MPKSTHDEQLFSKEDALLANSTHLAYQTIKCSPLNVEELRREEGLEVLNEAFDRCVTMLSQYSKDAEAEMTVQVCLHITRCFAVAANFEQCRQKTSSLQNLIKNLGRFLHFKNFPTLWLSAAEAISSFAPEPELQDLLYRHGVLVHLLFYMFNYDFTLEEGGVERASESNQQEIANSLARGCLKTCARLAGFHSGFEQSAEAVKKAPDSNNSVMQSLIALITPHLAKNLNTEPSSILKMMNSNTRSPYLLWDNSTRAEMRGYLEHQREILFRTGEFSDLFLYTRFKFWVLE